jgi:hypothetical protein
MLISSPDLTRRPAVRADHLVLANAPSLLTPDSFGVAHRGLLALLGTAAVAMDRQKESHTWVRPPESQLLARAGQKSWVAPWT